MDAMEKRVTIRGEYVNFEMFGSSPFTQEINKAMPSEGFKLPTMNVCNESADPIDHLEMFRTSMSIQGAGDAILCKDFPTTLKKAARSWFSSLPPRSICTFKDLWEKFVSQFVNSIAHKKTSITLMSIRQKPGEPLRKCH